MKIEKGNFNLVLTGYRLRIGFIQFIREHTEGGLGLAEAKALTDELPSTVLKNISQESANDVIREWRGTCEFTIEKAK